MSTYFLSQRVRAAPYFLQIARIVFVCFVYFATIAQVWVNLHRQHIMAFIQWWCEREPSPTWLRKYQEEDEEEAVTKRAIKEWRSSFHKYFTTFFYLFLFFNYFILYYFFYSFITHDIYPHLWPTTLTHDPRPTTSTHYLRSTTFSYTHTSKVFGKA